MHSHERVRVTKEYAESHQWWAEFLKARTNAIDSMVQLGKSKQEILRQLNLADEAHLQRIIYAQELE